MTAASTAKTSLVPLRHSPRMTLCFSFVLLGHSLDIALRREVSGATTLEAYSSRTAQLGGERLLLAVVKVDPAIRPSTDVVDAVFEHQFLSYSILVKRTVDTYAALNRKWGMLPCPDGTCTIHVLLETPLQVVGSADIILSILQLKHVHSLHRRVHATRALAKYRQ